MLTNKKLYFVLPLLATVSQSVGGRWNFGECTKWELGGKCCQSFEDVKAFNATSSVVSAPGFVESLTIPAGLEGQVKMLPHEFANGTVTSYPDKTRQHLDFQEKISLKVQGTSEKWPGEIGDKNPSAVELNWGEFMDYFANGGSGVVIALENHSTLTVRGSGHEFVARPEKGYKVAIASTHSFETTIAISHANILTIATEYAEGPLIGGGVGLWMATDNGLHDADDWPKRVNTMKNQRPNSCIVIDNLALTPSPTAPTPKPTASGAASACRGGLITAFSLFVAASLALC